MINDEEKFSKKNKYEFEGEVSSKVANWPLTRTIHLLPVGGHYHKKKKRCFDVFKSRNVRREKFVFFLERRRTCVCVSLSQFKKVKSAC